MHKIEFYKDNFVTMYTVKYLHRVLIVGVFGVFFFGFNSVVNAATYFVASLSTDCTANSGSGTVSSPWSNPFYVLTHNLVTAGDTLILRGGTYKINSGFGGVPCNISGNGIDTVLPLKISGITIENYPGETVIIDGTSPKVVSGIWSSCGSGWQTNALNIGSSNTAQVWVNPSGPDDPGTRLKWVSGGSCSSLQPGQFTSTGSSGNTISVRLPSDANPNNADIHIACQNGDCAAYPIDAESGANNVVVRRNPSGGSFYVKYGYYGFWANGSAQNITLDGINFVAHGGRDYGSCVRVYGGSNITVKNGICRESMGEGIEFYGGGPGGSNGNGVQLFGHIVENMDVYDNGMGWWDGGGNGNNLGMSIIIKNCNSCVVRGNKMHNNLANGVEVTNSTNGGVTSNDVIVENNNIYNFGYIVRDSSKGYGGRDVAGVFYISQNGETLNRPIVRNNTIDNRSATHGEAEDGIKFARGVAGGTITNNVMNGISGSCVNVSESGSSHTQSGNSCNSGGTVSPASTPPSPTTTLKGDFNNDKIVNSLDWSIMNSRWFINDVTADLNTYGIVNSLDFSIMNRNWLKTI